MNIGWGAIMGCIIGCMPPIIIGPPIGRTICILNIIKSNTTFNLHNSGKKRDKHDVLGHALDSLVVVNIV